MAFERTLALTSDGDIFTDASGRARFLSDEEAVITELKVLLSTIRGEDGFDTDHGLRLFEVSGASSAVLEREVRFALQSDDRVATVDRVTVEQSDATTTAELRNREVTVAVTLETDTELNFGVEL